MPSNPMKAGDGSGSASAVMPVLSYVAARLAAGTCTCAALISVCAVSPAPSRHVAVASRLSLPAVSPDDGAVTENVFDAEPPGATVPRLTWPAGDSVQPDGTLIDTEAADSGWLVGLRSVPRPVNVPSASVDDEIAASVGCGGGGRAYTAGGGP